MSAGLLSFGNFPTAGNNIAIVGLEFYAYDRDPSSPDFNPATISNSVSGFGTLNPFAWILVEDCKFSFFVNDIGIENDTSSNGNLYLRRNIVTDAYAITPVDSTGMLVGRTTVTLQENLFDHNGWNATVANTQPTVFNHNIYIAGYDPDSTTGNVAPNTGYLSVATVQANIFSNGQFRLANQKRRNGR